ncbi:REF/SRPP-like protein At3g05500 [Impatiens glandulifera]|uniref:REF/SRPP-like protein At3g05500 n=1 Tax=Impatiens glandulifera TaxID=253017 RepID=UPI001FB101EB|nr:REF/SRPP-like protein At3g05500 [Impatiens glandulifera]
MADSDLNSQSIAANEEEAQRLKYLQFVQVALLQAAIGFSRLYGYAKNNSGPLKPSVETVEGTVKAVVGPAYGKYHDVPIELLKFVDRKVDESVTVLDKRVPPLVKKVSTHAVSAAQNAPSTAKSVYAKYEPAAKDIYSKYEPVAEQYAVSAWQSLNRLPLFPRVANVMVPTAAYCSDKYNETVISTAEKGYRVASYLPLVPMEKIARVFTQEASAPAAAAN